MSLFSVVLPFCREHVAADRSWSPVNHLEDIQLACLIPDIKGINLDSFESVLPLEMDDLTVRDVDDFTTVFSGYLDNTFQGLLAELASWTT